MIKKIFTKFFETTFVISIILVCCIYVPDNEPIPFMQYFMLFVSMGLSAFSLYLLGELPTNSINKYRYNNKYHYNRYDHR